MEIAENEYVAPFSQELMSDKTMTEIKQLRAGGNTSQAYNPNTDTDARELGGDSFEVSVGDGMLPFSFILLFYILRKVIHTRKSSRF